MSATFTTYLEKKKKSKERICVYLDMKQETFDRSGNMKRNHLMLSGIVKNVDESALELSGQECLIMVDKIISIKPDKNY